MRSLFKDFMAYLPPLVCVGGCGFVDMSIVTAKARRGFQVSKNWCYKWLSSVRSKLVSSGRAVSICSHQTVSEAP